MIAELLSAVELTVAIAGLERGRVVARASDRRRLAHARGKHPT